MAKVQYSALVTSITGKVGGQVLQRNGSGYTLRNKARFNRPSSQRLVNWRNTVASISSSYRALNASQIAAWSSACPNNLFTDRLGNKYTPTPYHLFMQQNLLSIPSGASDLTTPGSPTSFQLTGIVDGFVIETGTPLLAFDIAYSLPSDQAFTIFSSAGNSQGRSSPVGGYKFIVQIAGNYPNSGNIYPQYFSVFGGAIKGSLVFLKIVTYSATSQNCAPPLLFSATVT